VYSSIITLRAVAQCIAIGPVCASVGLWQRAGGRCPNLTTASARSVCVSLSAFFSFLFRIWYSI